MTRTDAPTLDWNPRMAEPPGEGHAFRTTHRAWREALMRTLGRWWIIVFGLGLVGYVSLGKGFAFLPYSPAFFAELMLVAGTPLLLLVRRPFALFGQTTIILIAALAAWNLPQTLANLGTYGIDALRDSAIYYYAAFAVLVAGVFIDRPHWLPIAIRRIDLWGWVLIAVLPFLFVVQMALGGAMPRWPWVGEPVLSLKPGDTLLFAGSITALSIVGLGRQRSSWWYLPLAALLAAGGAISRGGLLAFTLAFGLAFACFPRALWAWRVVVLSAVIVVALLAMDVSFEVPGRQREFSVRQVAQNFTSAFVSVDRGDLDDTKNWRLEWWGRIVGYTFGGEHFWTGKGYGINLANSDGFQVFEDNSLRSPHNGHLTILARGGVPAFLLWITLHMSWLMAVGLGYLRARAKHQTGWTRFFVWVGAAYLAAMFVASFDVYLENPMGAVWTWSIVGLGIAGTVLAPRYPHLLDPLVGRPTLATGKDT
ncbi:MAG: O-antigen ligase family protein [Planctomycetota bacterium]